MYLNGQVDESHEGEYSCTPYNALGSEGASPGVRVRVQRPPALVARPHPLYVARLGDALTLPCAVETRPQDPPPTLHWTRVKHTISFISHIFIWIGSYRCHAQNICA